MGSTFANDLSSMKDLSLDNAISIHLQSNHYPPVPLSMVPVCIEAIDAYWEDSHDRKIDLPEGILWTGETYAPAWAIIEQHHLDAWCTESDEDYE